MGVQTIKQQKEEMINLSLNKRQFIDIFRFMGEQDRIEIYKELQKSLFLNRFEKLLQSTRTDDLSYDDITNEVETVRQERYETGMQISPNNH